MVLTRVILRSNSGITLHERFTRFMKNRGAEDGNGPVVKRNTDNLRSPSSRSKDGNSYVSELYNRTRVQKELYGRKSDSYRERSPHRSRRDHDRSDKYSKPSYRSRDEREEHRSAKDRLSLSAKDRLGRKQMDVKERLGNTLSAVERLGNIPDNIEYRQRDRDFINNKGGDFNNRGRGGPRGRGGSFRGGRGGRSNFNRNKEELNAEDLDRDMDSYMKSTKSSLDNALDSYMNAKSKAPEKVAETEKNVTVES